MYDSLVSKFKFDEKESIKSNNFKMSISPVKYNHDKYKIDSPVIIKRGSTKDITNLQPSNFFDSPKKLLFKKQSNVSLPPLSSIRKKNSDSFNFLNDIANEGKMIPKSKKSLLNLYNQDEEFIANINTLKKNKPNDQSVEDYQNNLVNYTYNIVSNYEK